MAPSGHCQPVGSVKRPPQRPLPTSWQCETAPQRPLPTGGYPRTGTVRDRGRSLSCAAKPTPVNPTGWRHPLRRPASPPSAQPLVIPALLRGTVSQRGRIVRDRGLCAGSLCAQVAVFTGGQCLVRNMPWGCSTATSHTFAAGHAIARSRQGETLTCSTCSSSRKPLAPSRQSPSAPPRHPGGRHAGAADLRAAPAVRAREQQPPPHGGDLQLHRGQQAGGEGGLQGRPGVPQQAPGGPVPVDAEHVRDGGRELQRAGGAALRCHVPAPAAQLQGGGGPGGERRGAGPHRHRGA